MGMLRVWSSDEPHPQEEVRYTFICFQSAQVTHVNNFIFNTNCSTWIVFGLKSRN